MQVIKRYECKVCNTISDATVINKVTIEDCCVNRKQRRSFIPIDNTIISDRKWYKCPACSNNVRRGGWEEK